MKTSFRLVFVVCAVLVLTWPTSALANCWVCFENACELLEDHADLEPGKTGCQINFGTCTLSGTLCWLRPPKGPFAVIFSRTSETNQAIFGPGKSRRVGMDGHAATVGNIQLLLRRLALDSEVDLDVLAAQTLEIEASTDLPFAGDQAYRLRAETSLGDSRIAVCGLRSGWPTVPIALQGIEAESVLLIRLRDSGKEGILAVGIEP
jgi:hypothetical protein